MQAREKEELVAERKEELDVEQLRVVWQGIRGAGFKSLYDYLHILFNTRDPILSAQVSQMLSYHGPEILNSIHACHHPDMAIDWVLSTSTEHIEAKWKVLIREFPFKWLLVDDLACFLCQLPDIYLFWFVAANL